MNTLKNRIYHAVYRIYAAALVFAAAYIPAYAAASADDITQKVTGPIDSICNILTAILAAVGGVMLIKSVAELVMAIHERDNSGMFQAGKGLVSAVLLMSVGLIVQLFKS